MRRDFEVKLLADVAIGTRGTIVGAKLGMDYLPGYLFLGTAAARLYKQLDRDQAWDVFHSGKLRFQDAHPLVAGETAWPTPLALHSKGKMDPSEEPTTYHNLCRCDYDVNHRRLKQGFLTSSGDFFKPQTHLRLKTAIDPATGRASNSRLFGLHAIKAGNRFHFSLQAHQLDPQLFERVAKILEGHAHLGMSRSAEYGLVEISPVEVTKDPQPKPLEDPKNVLLYLLSDMAVLDDLGQPTTCPKPQWLGLPSGHLNLQRSFLKHNSFTPFNGTLRRYEQERQTIAAGSVLCFSFETPPDFNALQQHCTKGLGLYRQGGLGRVWLNPPMLCDDEVTITKVKEKQQQTTHGPPKHPLAEWLVSRAEAQAREEQARQLAEQMGLEIPHLYHNARLLGGFPNGVPVGPSASQWGRVRDVARKRDMTLEQCRQVLFHDENAVCNEKDQDWGRSTLDATNQNQAIINFREWLQTQWKKLEAKPEVALMALALLARIGMSFTKNKQEVPS